MRIILCKALSVPWGVLGTFVIEHEMDIMVVAARVCVCRKKRKKVFNNTRQDNTTEGSTRQDKTTRQPRQDKAAQQRARYVSGAVALGVFGRQSSRKLLGPPNVAVEGHAMAQEGSPIHNRKKKCHGVR